MVISSFSTTFGIFFQKIAQNRGGVCGKKDDPSSTKRKVFGYWIAGFMMITFISFGLDLYAMGSLGQSVVVPLLAGLEVSAREANGRCEGGVERARARGVCVQKGVAAPRSVSDPAKDWVDEGVDVWGWRGGGGTLRARSTEPCRTTWRESGEACLVCWGRLVPLVPPHSHHALTP